MDGAKRQHSIISISCEQRWKQGRKQRKFSEKNVWRTPVQVSEQGIAVIAVTIFILSVVRIVGLVEYQGLQALITNYEQSHFNPVIQTRSNICYNSPRKRRISIRLCKYLSQTDHSQFDFCFLCSIQQTFPEYLLCTLFQTLGVQA